MAEISGTPKRHKQVVMVGLPHTGKTTFLALFYLAVTREKRTRLRLASWFGEREHLNEIAGRLLSCTEAARTPMEAQRQFDLPLQTPDGDVVQLAIPDLSGELWQEALRHRQWPAGIDERIEQADAKLLFLHAKEIDSGPSINYIKRLAQLLGEEPGGVEVTVPADAREPGRHAGLAGAPPTQVDLIDFIQMTCEQRGPERTRLALVISAWDWASGDPNSFVADNLPMLHQYLQANRAWLDCRVFGVSAQGGRFDDPDIRDELAERDPVARAIVKAGDGADAEAGAIVEWAIGLD